jgi:indole-3-glycerol phosphate synthase
MILDKIIASKKHTVNDLKKHTSYSFFEKQISHNQFQSFSFHNAIQKKGLSLIAEVKKASPSKGIIRKDFNHVEIASSFENNNASAISVLTDEEFFQGKNKYLSEIKEKASLPILRKDFIIDEIQILESKAIGADAILLIAAILSEKEIERFNKLAIDIGLDTLCEVHSLDELKKTEQTNCKIIGINNRNLNDFSVTLNTTTELKKHINPNKLVISESGISNKKELSLLQENNINAVLIGEGLATNTDLITYFKND